MVLLLAQAASERPDSLAGRWAFVRASDQAEIA
jgi:hypothetical protein